MIKVPGLLIVFLIMSEGSSSEYNGSKNLMSTTVYKQVAESAGKNIFFSPLSAEIVLALIESGAKDDTAAEISNTLHLPNSKEVQNLLRTVLNKEGYTLQTANKIYIKDGLPIKQNFKTLAQQTYHADIENINFSKSSNAAEAMNKWVEEQTNHKIEKLINPNILSSDSVAILVNALYFSANWSNPFLYTDKINFYKTNTDFVQVDAVRDFINHQDPVSYGENQELDAKFLELTFQNEDASLIIVLPNKRDGISNLEKSLDLAFAHTEFTKEYVNVTLPKFEIETQIQLKEILIQLGVRKAFTPGEADFSGLAGSKGDIYIDDVIQKSFIKVDEEGVEAAAATFGHAVLISMPPPPTKTFLADHPFFFYIKVKNVIVFEGKVVDPTQ